VAVPGPASADWLKPLYCRARARCFSRNVSFRKTSVLPQTQRR